MDATTWTRRGRLLVAALAASGIAALAGTAATASALSVDLSCSGTARLAFAPPLNGSPTSATGTGDLIGCISPNTTHRFLKSGAISATGLSASGCFPLFRVSGTVTLKWNDGSTSTLSAALSTDFSGAPKLEVRVTAGRMYGDTLTLAPTFIPHGLGCGLGGTRSLDVQIASLLFTNNRSAVTARARQGRAKARRSRTGRRVGTASRAS